MDVDAIVNKLLNYGTPFSIIAARWIRLEGSHAVFDPLLKDLIQDVNVTTEKDNTSINVFCDGSCTNNGKTGAKAGYGVYITNNRLPIHSHSDKVPSSESQTNQRAELTALEYAFKYIASSGIQHANIYTDSKYAINCITTWGASWKRAGWVKADKKPIQHLEKIQSMIAIWETFGQGIQIHHVKAHTQGTDPISLGNAEADRLANAAAS